MEILFVIIMANIVVKKFCDEKNSYDMIGWKKITSNDFDIFYHSRLHLVHLWPDDFLAC